MEEHHSRVLANILENVMRLGINISYHAKKARSFLIPWKFCYVNYREQQLEYIFSIIVFEMALKKNPLENTSQ